MLLIKLLREFLLQLLQFPHGEFRGIQAARNLRVEVSANHAAQRNRHHDPKCNSGEPAKLEGRMERNDEGSRNAKHHVNIEPVPCASLLAEPRPSFPKG